jgi:hypothetical protein
MRRTILVLLLASTFPLIGQAQHRGGGAMPSMSGAHAFVAAAPMGVAHAAPVRSGVSARPVVRSAPVSTRPGAAPRAAHPIGWNQNRTTRRTNFSTDPVFPNGGFSTGGNPVPGLGFDYPHFFAVHPNAGRRFRRDSGFVIPFIDGGFYMPVPMYADQGAPPQQPDDSEAAYQPPPPDQIASRDNDSDLRDRMRAEPLPPEETEYVFVRRDGSLIFAVAYTLINDRLQYVTAEGLRRTVPLTTLDLGATQQFNEQRGVSIRLPA